MPTLYWAVSSAVEHCLHTAGVTGSNPVPPTTPKSLINKGVLGTITLPLGKLMLPKSSGKDMLPSKSQPDFGWLLLFFPPKSVSNNQRHSMASATSCRPEQTLDWLATFVCIRLVRVIRARRLERSLRSSPAVRRFAARRSAVPLKPGTRQAVAAIRG